MTEPEEVVVVVQGTVVVRVVITVV